jgi:hypothetical protein
MSAGCWIALAAVAVVVLVIVALLHVLSNPDLYK